MLADAVSGDGQPPEGETPEQAVARLTAERDKWKGLSRKNETRARENASAAARVAELEQANMTELQKAQAAAQAATQRAVEAERLHHRTLAAARFELHPDLIPYLAGDNEAAITESAETLARVINERVAAAQQTAQQQAPAGNGLSQRRPVEALRPGAAPAGSTAPQDKNVLFREAVARATGRQ
jgi:hypothetical protein